MTRSMPVGSVDEVTTLLTVLTVIAGLALLVIGYVYEGAAKPWAERHPAAAWMMTFGAPIPLILIGLAFRVWPMVAAGVVAGLVIVGGWEYLHGREG
jgi:hypothetical protein